MANAGWMITLLVPVACLSVVSSSVIAIKNRPKHDIHLHEQRRLSFHLDRTGDIFLRRSKRETPNERQTYITSLRAATNINCRFAETVISSEIENRSPKDHEVRFRVYLPDTAFISNFTMLIDGVLEVAVVKAKDVAQAEYEEARERNTTAGLVSDAGPSLARKEGMQVFDVAVNIAGDSLIGFDLFYQQLLERRLGWYKHTISIEPNQVVDDLQADIHIYEPQGISKLQVKEPGVTSGNVDAYISEVSDEVKRITYKPSSTRQGELGADKANGVSGELIVEYDVKHYYDPGYFRVENGYFVHLISPEDNNELPPLGKNIIFVIDISGSMDGLKMEQTQESVHTILGDLNQSDRFMLILFDDEVTYWPGSKELVQANSDKIEEAQDYARDNLVADGSTNINDALVQAAELLKGISSAQGSKLIIFLTDGQPTAGVTDADQILNNVMDAVAGQITIYCLGFGEHLNYDLLQKLSYRTGGFARRIFSETNAQSQLTDFFLEFNTLLLYDIRTEYDKAAVAEASLTTNEFTQYFKGSELVVVGELLHNAPQQFDVKLHGRSNEVIQISDTVSTTQIDIPASAVAAYKPGFVERLYAYWKIKSLLIDIKKTDDEEEQADLEEQALQLALDYHLVTPLTSMVIVQSTNDLHSEGEGDGDSAYDSGGDLAASSTPVFAHSILAILVHNISVCSAFAIYIFVESAVSVLLQ